MAWTPMGNLAEICDETGWTAVIMYDRDLKAWRGQMFSEVNQILCQVIDKNWSKASRDLVVMAKNLRTITELM